MITRQRRKTVFRRLGMPLLAAGFLTYFGYHAFSGSFGIWARDRLEIEAARLTIDRDRLVAERETLEQKVASVRPSSLDADVIDLAARHALSAVRPDEVVVRPGATQHSVQH